MRKRNKIAWALTLAFVLSALTVGVIGCLSISDEEYDAEFDSAGNLELMNFPDIQMMDDDDDYYYDDDDDYYGDDDDDNTGPYCEALIECVCSELDGYYYDNCVDSVESLSEDYCKDFLEENLPECLPY